MATQNQAGMEEIEKLLKDYQLLQEQMRSIAMQIEQMQTQKIELERAKEEIEKSSGKIFLTIGNVIVESSKDKAKTDVIDKQSMVEIRLQSMNKQYTEMKNKDKQLNEKLTQIYKADQGQQ
ncbi:MAG: prefoldin subunit [Candidatus Micrarchaeaceae archaeon]